MKYKLKYKDFISFLYNYLNEYMAKLSIVFIIVMIYSVCLVYFPKLLGKLIKYFEKYTTGTHIIFPQSFYDNILMILGLIILTYSLKIIINYSMYPISEKITLKLRKNIYRKLQTGDARYLFKNNSGNIMGRINHDTLNIRNLIGIHLTSMLSKFALVVMILVLMYYTNSILANFYFLTFVVYMFMMYLITRRTAKYYNRLQEYVGQLIAQIGDTILNKTVLTHLMLQILMVISLM